MDFVFHITAISDNIKKPLRSCSANLLFRNTHSCKSWIHIRCSKNIIEPTREISSGILSPQARITSLQPMQSYHHLQKMPLEIHEENGYILPVHLQMTVQTQICIKYHFIRKGQPRFGQRPAKPQFSFLKRYITKLLLTYPSSYVPIFKRYSVAIRTESVLLIRTASKSSSLFQ